MNDQVTVSPDTLRQDTKAIKYKITVCDNLLSMVNSKLTLQTADDARKLADQLGFKASWSSIESLWSHIIRVQKRNLPKRFVSALKPMFPNYYSWSDDYMYFNNGSIPTHILQLVEIQKVYTRDDQYILEFADGAFTVDITDFEAHGLQASSLRLGRPKDQGLVGALGMYTVSYENNAVALRKGTALVTTIPGDLLTIGQKDAKRVLIVNKNKFERTIVNDDDTYIQETPIAHAYGKIEQIQTDRNENFVLAVVSREEGKKLCILNRKSLEVIDEIDDIAQVLWIDKKNDVSCVNSAWNIVHINTNFDQFPTRYVDGNAVVAEHEVEAIQITDKPRSDLKNLLSGGGITLSHSTTEALDETWVSSDDITLREQLRATPVDGLDGKTLKELYASATTPQEIDIVYHIALQLKKNPHVMSVKWLVDPIISTITSKRDSIRLQDIAKQLWEISTDLASVHDFTSMISLKNKLTTIKQTRSQILAVDKDTDILLKETLHLINQKIEEYQTEHLETITQDIDANCKHISAYMEGIDYLPQVTSIYGTDLWKQTEVMLTYLDDTHRKSYKKKMSDIVLARQHALSKQQKTLERSWLQQQEEIILYIKNKFTQLKGILESISDEHTLKTMEMSDPLVLEIKDTISWLPSNKRQELTQRLEQIFKERMLSIQFTAESNVSSIKSLDQYGIPKWLYFVPDITQKINRDISGKRTKDDHFKLQFTSSTGNTIEPSINKKILGNFKFTYTYEEWLDLRKSVAEWNSNGVRKKYAELKKDAEKNKSDIEALEKKFYVARMLETMNKISGENKMRSMHHRNNLPSLDNKTVITKTIQESLAKWWRILSQQIQYRQGIMIVESEAWTGKNFKCDILWHLTNREVFDVSCNEYMEKEDLLFSPEIDEEGTHRKPSKLVQWLQTPGAIIVFDEINTLKPWVSKLLNPLLDGRRYINDPQMWRIYAHPSVMLVGLMNPRYYRGTKELPQEIVSRARMTDDKYSQPQEEAFQISRYLDGPLWKLSQEEFDHYRNEYITRNQVPTDKTVYNHILWLDKIVKVAKKMREVNAKTMRWDATMSEELNFVFTTREWNYAVQDFNYTKNIQQSLEDVVLMKIADAEQKDYAKKIIGDICV